MDKNFTEKIVAWLETPADERDYEQGALYLLQLNNNQIMYRNVLRNLKKHADFIEYQIRKYVKFRLASLTHEQVQEMQTAVDKIVAERHLDKIVVQPFIATDDPSVLGIKPIPNIEEKINALIEKYRAESMDIDDIEWEEADVLYEYVDFEEINESDTDNEQQL